MMFGTGKRMLQVGTGMLAVLLWMSSAQAQEKAIHDPAVGAAEDACLPADRPLASQRPLIEREPPGSSKDATAIQPGSAVTLQAHSCSVVTVTFPVPPLASTMDIDVDSET